MDIVDIHSHLIYGVDDGSKSLEQSIEYLNQIRKIGINKIVCTPHFKYGSIEKINLVKKNFIELKGIASNMGIDLYLGNEIMYSDKTLNLLKRKKLLGINFTNYILIEFKRNESRNFNDILNILEELLENGFKPVLAHPELYVNYHTIENMRLLKENGIMIQIDATSLFQKRTKKLVKKMLNERLVDVVSSDSHCTKKRNYLKFNKSFKKIKKKYGLDYTITIFSTNPSMILNLSK